MAHYLDSTGLTTLWAKIKALIPTSLKNPNALTIQLNGTSQGAYDGSSAKTVNVTKSSIGLGNVDNTADANKSVASATKVVASVTGTNSAELVRGNMADNDQFRILVGGTASNAGYAELATADDGSEPIYVRQYTGVFTNLARTATLLDGSGNTSFPGTVSASSFSGNLSGNATTATTAYSAQNAVTASTATSATSATTATVAKDNGTHAETASGTTGNKPTAGMLYDSGMYMTRTYNDSAAPVSYGNIINVAGGGTGQLLLGWAGDNTIGDIWYRSHRDTNSGGWSAWKRLAYATEIPSVPTSLKNPNALTMQANGTTVASYDGSSAKTVNITPASIGAAAASHTHSYLPLSGGTVTGNVTMSSGNLTVNKNVRLGSASDDSCILNINGDGYIFTLTSVDIYSDSLQVTDNVAIGTDIDTNYALKVVGNTYVNGSMDITGTTTISQSCTFSNSEAHFGVNGSYTDPYNGQAAGFKFGGSIAATYGYFYYNVKAKNIIVNEGNLLFIVNGTTYKLNMSKAVTLGLVTT